MEIYFPPPLKCLSFRHDLVREHIFHENTLRFYNQKLSHIKSPKCSLRQSYPSDDATGIA